MLCGLYDVISSVWHSALANMSSKTLCSEIMLTHIRISCSVRVCVLWHVFYWTLQKNRVLKNLRNSKIQHLEIVIDLVLKQSVIFTWCEIDPFSCLFSGSINLSSFKMLSFIYAKKMAKTCKRCSEHSWVDSFSTAWPLWVVHGWSLSQLRWEWG